MTRKTSRVYHKMLHELNVLKHESAALGEGEFGCGFVDEVRLLNAIENYVNARLQEVGK